MKFAEYMAWILVCKHCKFGDKIFYNSRDIEFFLGDYFFLVRPVVAAVVAPAESVQEVSLIEDLLIIITMLSLPACVCS